MSKLRTARTAKNLTLAAVANAVGTDPGNLSRIERGEQAPSRELARLLYDYFDGSVPLAAIYDSQFEDAPTRPPSAGRCGQVG